MEIREERTSDRAAILDIQRRAFRAGARVVRLIEALLRDEPDALSIVADDQGAIVGHALFTSSVLDTPERLLRVQVLNPVGVAPERQRCGIGAALIRHGLRVLEARGEALLFLEGDPHYYSQLGFSAVGDAVRKPSLRIPDAAFQWMKLGAYEPWMMGTLVYARAFWECD